MAPLVLVYVALLAAGLMAPVASFAQGPPQGSPPGAPQGPQLTLQECIRRALKNAPELGEAQADVTLMKAKLSEASGYRYPQLDFLGLVGPSQRARGNQVSSPDSIYEKDHLSVFERGDLTIVQPIYTFGKISNNENAAKHGIEVEKLRQEQRRNEIALKVKEYYYSVLLAREMREVLTEVREDLDKARGTANKLLQKESENVQEADLYKLDAFGGEVGSYLALAEKGEELALSALSVRMGGDTAGSPAIADERLVPVNQPLLKYEDYVARAKVARPEFKQVSEGLQAREYLVKAARANRYPDIFLGAYISAAHAGWRDTINNPYVPDQFNHFWTGFALGLKWKLDFGITSAKIAQEQAQYDKLVSTKAFADENIPLQIRKFYDEGIQAQRTMQETKRGYENSKKWAVSASSNFDFGLGPAKDIFDSLQQYAKMRAAYFQAIYDYNMAIANLGYAVGDVPQ